MVPDAAQFAAQEPSENGRGHRVPRPTAGLKEHSWVCLYCCDSLSHVCIDAALVKNRQISQRRQQTLKSRQQDHPSSTPTTTSTERVSPSQAACTDAETGVPDIEVCIMRF